MSDTSISVIIPCFNSEKTIMRALDSVRSQKYQPDEILVYDDASDDYTFSILENYSLRFPKVSIYRGEENNGVGFARQFLINKAKGKFIAFLDSDDVWHPNKLQVQLAKLACSGADICICDYQVLDEAGKKLGVRRMPKTVSFFSLHFSNWIPTSMVLFRRDITQNVTMSDLRTRQDYAYWLTVFKTRPDTKCVAINQTLGTYYRNNSGLSGSAISNIKANYHMFRVIFGYSKVKACLVVFFNGVFRVIRV